MCLAYFLFSLYGILVHAIRHFLDLIDISTQNANQMSVSLTCLKIIHCFNLGLRVLRNFYFQPLLSCHHLQHYISYAELDRYLPTSHK
jgi:hypothetical protein